MALVSSVAAIGIAPGTVELPYANSTYDLVIVNTRDSAQEIGLSVTGELADSIRLPSDAMTLSPNERRQIEVKVNPGTLLPGEHSALIGVYEMVEEEGTVSAAAGVLSKLVIRVPYPGIYIESRLRATETDIVIIAINRGSEDILATALIRISGNGRQLSNLTAERLLRAGEMRELVAPHNLAKGRYIASVELNHSPDSMLEFTVGEPSVSLVSITGEQSGEYFDVRVAMRSDWNVPMMAFATLSSEGYSTASSTISMEPAEVSEFRLFWPVSEGRNATLRVDFEGLSIMLPVSIQEPAEEEPILVLIIILAALALLTIIARLHGKKR